MQQDNNFCYSHNDTWDNFPLVIMLLVENSKTVLSPLQESFFPDSDPSYIYTINFKTSFVINKFIIINVVFLLFNKNQCTSQGWWCFETVNKILLVFQVKTSFSWPIVLLLSGLVIEIGHSCIWNQNQIIKFKLKKQ